MIFCIFLRKHKISRVPGGLNNVFLNLAGSVTYEWTPPCSDRYISSKRQIAKSAVLRAALRAWQIAKSFPSYKSYEYRVAGSLLSRHPRKNQQELIFVIKFYKKYTLLSLPTSQKH